MNFHRLAVSPSRRDLTGPWGFRGTMHTEDWVLEWEGGWHPDEEAAWDDTTRIRDKYEDAARDERELKAAREDKAEVEYFANLRRNFNS